MQRYKCKKVVMAGLILSVAIAGSVVALSVDTGEGEPKLFELPTTAIVRYKPEAGDYLVEYDGGYQAISPKQAFEDGYEKLII